MYISVCSSNAIFKSSFNFLYWTFWFPRSFLFFLFEVSTDIFFSDSSNTKSLIPKLTDNRCKYRFLLRLFVIFEKNGFNLSINFFSPFILFRSKSFEASLVKKSKISSDFFTTSIKALFPFFLKNSSGSFSLPSITRHFTSKSYFFKIYPAFTIAFFPASSLSYEISTLSVYLFKSSACSSVNAVPRLATAFSNPCFWAVSTSR